MASLANQTISSTYDGLVKTSTDQPVPISGVQLLEDGVGNSLALSVGRANQGVTITGTATATAFSGDLTGDVTGDLTGNVSGNLTGNVSGNVTGDLTGDVTGTVLTAAQTNITSLGTLSSLAVSGNSGFGTSSPSTKVHALASGTPFSSAAGTVSVFQRSGASFNGCEVSIIAGNGGSSVLNFGDTDDENVGYLNYIHSDNSLRIGTGAAERMCIDSSGNVGIGTSGPDAIFHIESGVTATSANILLESTHPSGIPLLDIKGAASSQIRYIDETGAIQTRIDMLDSGEIRFVNASGAVERMRITSGGDILVGKTNATATGEGVVIVENGTIYSSVPSTENTFLLWNDTTTGYKFYVSAAGQIYAISTSISAISDARLKENIQDLTGGLDAIMSLKPRTYDWKADSGQTGTGVRGFIAQEVEEVFPEYVDEYKTDEIPEDGVPYKSVRQDFIPFLVKAIQEQQEIINDLKSRIETLEAK